MNPILTGSRVFDIIESEFTSLTKVKQYIEHRKRELVNSISYDTNEIAMLCAMKRIIMEIEHVPQNSIANETFESVDLGNDNRMQNLFMRILNQYNFNYNLEAIDVVNRALTDTVCDFPPAAYGANFCRYRDMYNKLWRTKQRLLKRYPAEDVSKQFNFQHDE